MMKALCWGVVASATVLLAGCGTDTEKPAGSATSDTGGYSDAAVALVATGTDGSDGALMLVGNDGAVRSVPTTVLSGAEAVRVGDTVQLAGTDKDLLLSATATTFVPHTWDIGTVQDTVAAGGTSWTFGKRNADLSVVAGQGDDALTGTFYSASAARTACGDDVMAVLGDDETDLATRTVRLIRYRTDGTKVAARAEKVPAPTLVGGTRVACVNGDPVVLALDSAGQPQVAQQHDGRWAWGNAPAKVVGTEWGKVVGVVDTSVVLQTETGLRSWNLTEHTMAELSTWPSGTGSASVQGNKAIVWVGGDQAALTVIDLASGKTDTTITTEQITAQLATDGRTVQGSPVLLG